MDCVLYQIFQIISSISSKKHQKVTDNLIENRKQKQKIEIENKIENWITFKNKAVYDILTPDTIKLLASTEKKKIPKNENRENVPDSEITEVYYDIVNNGYQHDSRVICSIKK